MPRAMYQVVFALGCYYIRRVDGIVVEIGIPVICTRATVVFATI